MTPSVLAAMSQTELQMIRTSSVSDGAHSSPPGSVQMPVTHPAEMQIVLSGKHRGKCFCITPVCTIDPFACAVLHECPESLQ